MYCKCLYIKGRTRYKILFFLYKIRLKKTNLLKKNTKQEQPLVTAHARDIWATQRNANQIYLENNSKKSFYLHADLSITDIGLTEQHLMVTNGRAIAVYKITKQDNRLDDPTIVAAINNNTFTLSTPMNTFKTECIEMFVYDENVIVLGQSDVKIYSLGGVVLREIHFNDTEGEFFVFKLFAGLWGWLYGQDNGG